MSYKNLYKTYKNLYKHQTSLDKGGKNVFAFLRFCAVALLRFCVFALLRFDVFFHLCESRDFVQLFSVTIFVVYCYCVLAIYSC